MPAITLTINNDLISARQGQTLLDVAREHGIEIPTLCHLDGLEAMGGCRLCLVELQGTPLPVPSCITKAAEGMVVTTSPQRAKTLVPRLLPLPMALKAWGPILKMEGILPKVSTLLIRVGQPHSPASAG